MQKNEIQEINIYVFYKIWNRLNNAVNEPNS